MNEYTQQLDFFSLKPAENLNSDIASLPKAYEIDLFSGSEKSHLEDFKAIQVDTGDGRSSPNDERPHDKKVVFCPKKDYKVVQHEQAFRPLIEGLTQAGIRDFEYILYNDLTRAYMNILTTDQVADSVRLGLSAQNSFDGSSSLRYGFRIEQSKRTVELVGYRMACKNGMLIRVPMDRAEIVKKEVVDKVKRLYERSLTFRHTKNVLPRIQQVQYITEAISLLKEPVKEFIKQAQEVSLEDQKFLDRVVNAHVKSRYKKKVLDRYALDEGNDLWDLYNAMTYVASHDNELKVSGREKLKEKAADMLVKVTATTNGNSEEEIKND